MFTCLGSKQLLHSYCLIFLVVQPINNLSILSSLVLLSNSRFHTGTDDIQFSLNQILLFADSTIKELSLHLNSYFLPASSSPEPLSWFFFKKDVSVMGEKCLSSLKK